MNKLIPALLLALIAATGTAWADSDKPEDGKSSRLEHMTRQLGLDAEQKAKVGSILEAQEGKRKALREETRTQLQAVLSKEQFARLEERGGRRLGGEGRQGKKGCHRKGRGHSKEGREHRAPKAG